MDANLRASVSFLLPNYRQSYLLMASLYLSVNVNLATVMSRRSIKVKFYCAAHHSGIVPRVQPQVCAAPSKETNRPSFDKTKEIFPTHQNYKSQFRHRGEYLNFLKMKQANGGEVEICKFSCCLLCAVALVLILEYLHYPNYSVPVLCARLERPRNLFHINFHHFFDISIMIRAAIFHARRLEEAAACEPHCEQRERQTTT